MREGKKAGCGAREDCFSRISLIYQAAGARTIGRQLSGRPGAMAAEIIWPHNAFNYVAVPSETVGEGG